MFNWAKKSWFLLLVLFAACDSKQTVSILPVETFFKNVQQHNYSISPNGESIAFLKIYNGKLNVFVRGISDTTERQVTNVDKISVKSFSWVGNNQLFCESERDSANSFGAFLINKDGKKQFEIVNKPNTKINILDKKVHNNTVLITNNDRDETIFDVYKLNLQTGLKTLFVKNPGNILLWFADADGEVNLGVGGDGVNETIYYRSSAKELFKAVISNNFKTTITPIGFKKDKRYIYALSNLNRDKLALVEFDCVKGVESKLIYENSVADISEVVTDKRDGEPAVANYQLEKKQRQFIKQSYKLILADLVGKLPNQEIKIADSDSAQLNFIIRTHTDKDPGAYYSYNVKTKILQRLSAVNPAINPNAMCAMEAISYITKDGLKIHGYLTYPLGNSRKNLPCVILPHQGPNQRNFWGFSPEVQFLANRGYAVLQMNYRGSTGYGKAFQIAGFKEWGGKMQDDIFEGVTWLINKGIADPKRIGIFGYGFGGYSALNQIIKYPNTYQCAASYSGYINLFTYIKGFPAYFKPYKLMLDQMIGNPETDIDYLKSASPVFQLDKITKPILIAQGGKDAKVNVNETNQFIKELRKNKIAVNYILNENETQLFKDTHNKLAFYTQLGSFLDQHLTPQ